MAAMSAFLLQRVNLWKHTLFLHSPCCTLLSLFFRHLGRSMVVGLVPTVHTCSFMCTNHTGMIVHTAAFFNESQTTLSNVELISCSRKLFCHQAALRGLEPTTCVFKVPRGIHSATAPPPPICLFCCMLIF